MAEVSSPANSWILELLMWVVGGIATLVVGVIAWLVNMVWSSRDKDVAAVKVAVETNRVEVRTDILKLHERIDKMDECSMDRHLELMRMLGER